MRIILPITDHREMAVVRRAQKYSLLTGKVRFCGIFSVHYLPGNGGFRADSYRSTEIPE
jgi:hypothetical protein